MRKLATIRRITGVNPIVGKDRIVQYLLDGWMVIDLKDQYQVGDAVIYCEPDSWMPHTIAAFLSKDKEPNEYLGIKGEKLRTVKMGGAISQGLILPVSILGESLRLDEMLADRRDVSDILGIVKWEPPVFMSETKGNFPEFIEKTDQERIQNLVEELGARDPEETFELTEKLDGQSFTAYFKDGTFGICSRNFELKTDVPSVFLQTVKRYDLENKLSTCGQNIAIQGEQVGPGIQKNVYGLKSVALYVFDVFNIDTGRYLFPSDARKFAENLGLQYVPLIADSVPLKDILPVDKALNDANRKSSLASIMSEGIIYKSNSDAAGYSFKAISNDYLVKPGKRV